MRTGGDEPPTSAVDEFLRGTANFARNHADHRKPRGKRPFPAPAVDNSPVAIPPPPREIPGRAASRSSSAARSDVPRRSSRRAKPPGRRKTASPARASSAVAEPSHRWEPRNSPRFPDRGVRPWRAAPANRCSTSQRTARWRSGRARGSADRSRRVPSPADDPKREKNRLHTDLGPTGRSQDEGLRRLLALGAHPADVGQTARGSRHVLAGPEDNEFCLLEAPNRPGLTRGVREGLIGRSAEFAAGRGGPPPHSRAMSTNRL